MYKFKYKDNYIKKAKNFFEKNPDLIDNYKIIITLLEKDPFEPALALQHLYKELRELYFIDITIDKRMVLYIDNRREIIYLIDIGKIKKI